MGVGTDAAAVRGLRTLTRPLERSLPARALVLPSLLSLPSALALPLVLSLPGWLTLVVEPLRWLWTTWIDPSYRSDGQWVALALVGLLVRSVASGPPCPAPRAGRMALSLLLATGLLRVIGVIAGVRLLGGLALVLDVAALAVWLRVDRRPWPLHLGCVTALAALALPVENAIQRIAAHPFQLAATAAAETLLRPAYSSLVRQGTVLGFPGVDLSVDVPCSGAHGLWLLFVVAAVGMSRRRASFWGWTRIALATLAAAFAANTLRVVLLFVGTAWGWPVGHGPLHSALGALTLATATIAIAASLSFLPRLERRGAGTPPVRPHPIAFGWTAAAIVSACGLATWVVPTKPFDHLPTEAPTAALPARLGSLLGVAVSASQQELDYFSRYGGSVEKRSYRDPNAGAWNVLRVRTRSPLRHLHGPDRCLIGAGHRVTRVGVTTETIPGVVYRSVAPDTSVWRVQASFVSDDGQWASGVSEVVWRWLLRPGTTWNLIERISPWSVCQRDGAACRHFDAALFAALDITPPSGMQRNRLPEE